MTDQKLTIAIAGSTNHTVICAQALLHNPNFKISWILTPQAKPVGRKKELKQNPLHQFALKNDIPVVLVDRKIDDEIKEIIIKGMEKNKKIANHFSLITPHFLLVVDFGYFIPNWLLKLPNIAPVNIHPSDLPKWRGSSPGQFVLLAGDKKSAVSIMEINDKFDQGPIINKQQFEVDPSWTQTEYYLYSFNLISKALPQILVKYANKEITAKTQPLESPTPMARRLKKADAFVDWQILTDLMQNEAKDENLSVKLPLANPNSAQIVQACKAFQPWPVLWTLVPTTKGEKRMKIYACHVEQSKLILDEVQIEGKNKTKWNEIKNLIN